MLINLPNRADQAMMALNNEQKGLIFSALLCHARGEDAEIFEKLMTPEAHMAFQFLVMWNDAQKKKFQDRRIKYNADARTSGTGPERS